jgi:hypothetical protein
LDIATNFAFGEEAVGAIFLDAKDKGKQKVDDAPKGSTSRDFKRKKKRNRPGKQERREDDLIAAADRKNL